MSNNPQCPQCGATLPENAPAGLCPNCLMALNLKTETVFTEDNPAAQPPLPPEALAPHFPQLEILELLGRGGMGVVYKARQKTLNRLVALKLLAPERVQDAKFAERFAREAQALAALNHPNIVTVYDFGQAGGFYYLLMEFVDGANLRQLLRARKFTPEEALAIVPPLCEALQFAHERGIVHRDIKPENLLLDKAGRVKIADFGIAKMLGGDAGPGNASPGGIPTGDSPSGVTGPAGGVSSSALTGEQTIGTPGYSAPEQKDAPQKVDSRADIYSLGVVFYEMLTGELPGKRLEAPSRKVQIDVRLDEVVLRALEKMPERRWQTAAELRTQVETIATSMARTPGTPPNPSPADRHRPSDFEPRCSRTALAGAVLWLITLMAFAASVAIHIETKATAPLIHHLQQATEPQDSNLIGLWSGFIHFDRYFIRPLAGLSILAATLLGWLAISQIRRSAGRLYGLGLALFDGIFFPLCLLDCLIVALPLNGWANVSHEVNVSFWLIVAGSILAAAALDFWLVRRIWHAVRTGPGSPDALLGPSSGRDSKLASVSLFSAGLSGLLGAVGFFLFPALPAPLVWAILAAALAGVALGSLSFKSALGKTGLLVGGVNALIWLAVGLTVQSRVASTPPVSAEFHYRVFEADAALVDRLIPATQRSSGVLPSAKSDARGGERSSKRSVGDFAVSTRGAAVTEPQLAEISPSTLDALLRGISDKPGVLVERRREVSSLWWRPGLADGWSYSRADRTLLGGGGGNALLGFRTRGGFEEVRIEVNLQHNLDTLQRGANMELNSKLLYEGKVPQDRALVFLVPFFRKDDSAHYLVVVYEINGPAPAATPAGVTQNLRFGPEHEFTLREGGDASFLDLDRGLVLPAYRGKPGEFKAWQKAQHIDLAIGSAEPGKDGVTGFDLSVRQLSSNRWPSITPRAVVHPDNDDASEPDFSTNVFLPAGYTYSFVTSEIGAGVLQVVETAQPGEVTVRYKMIQAPVSFGPAFERVVEMKGLEHRALNLGSADFVTPPPDQDAFDFSPNGTNRLRAAGVDLYASDNPRQPGALNALDMRKCGEDVPQGDSSANSIGNPFNTIDNYNGLVWWLSEDGTAALSAKELVFAAALTADRTRRLQPHEDVISGTNVWEFATRDGVEGVLQVVGYIGDPDHPRAAKIRYKLLRRAR